MKNEILWENGIRHCQEYFNAHGDLQCGATYVCADGFKLGQWLSRKRCAYNKNKLSEDKVKMLEELNGFDRRKVADVDTFCSHLKKYAEDLQTLIVPYTYVCDDGYRLGYYDSYFRRCKNNQGNRKLQPNEINALNTVGFIWDKQDYVWQTGYKHAEAFWKENNNLLVLQDHHCSDGYNLGSWIRRQRMLFQSDAVFYPKEKYYALCNIGMLWDKVDIWWMRAFNNACKLYDSKHCLDTAGMSPQYAKQNIDAWITSTKPLIRQFSNTFSDYHLLRLYADKLNQMFKEVQ